MRTLDLDIFTQINDNPKSTGQDLVQFIQHSLGAWHVSFMVLRYPGSVVHQGNYGFSTYSDEWVGHYVKNQFWKVDPAVTLGLRRATAFDWSEAEQSPELEKFWDVALKFGVRKQGFTIPLHGPNREAYIFSVSIGPTMDQDHLWRPMRMKMIRDLLPVAHAMQQRALNDLGLADHASPFIHLNGPKREILHWAANGKTAYETAKILNITERAVREHREGILKELNCVSITQAVAEALKTGLITDGHNRNGSIAS